MSGDIAGCYSSGRGLLASSGQRPGLLLNILHSKHTGQAPIGKDYPTKNINSAEVEKSSSRVTATPQ